MKEKINVKNFISTLLTAYMVIVACLVIFNYSTAVKSVDLFDSQDNIELLNDLKQEAYYIRNTQCRDIINELIQKYEDTSYNGKTSLKSFYISAVKKGDSIISYYPRLREACYISDEEGQKYNFPYLFTSALTPDDEIMKEFIFQYELHVKDYFTRDVLDFQIANVEYQIQRKSELAIISSLIEMERDKGEL